jgi:hypothetical protein
VPLAPTFPISAMNLKSVLKRLPLLAVFVTPSSVSPCSSLSGNVPDPVMVIESDADRFNAVSNHPPVVAPGSLSLWPEKPPDCVL